MGRSWMRIPLAVGMALGIAGCTTPEDDMSQLQRSVKSGLRSMSLEVSDAEICATPDSDLRRAYLIMNTSSGPQETSNATKRAQLKLIFY